MPELSRQCGVVDYAQTDHAMDFFFFPALCFTLIV